MARLPGRTPSPEEVQLQKEQEKVGKHIENNEKIRCPCCKKNQYFDNYLVNKNLGALVCPQCGIVFLDKHKIKAIKKHVQQQQGRIQGAK
jgi:DNA-directed RNA polymerase subunit RPC12/RpoP